MKTVWIFLCFLQICLAQSVVEHTDELVRKCKVEVNASDDDIKMILEKKMPTSYSGLCVLACVYEKNGVIVDGKFVMENFNKAVDNGTVAIGGKLAKRYINEVNEECKNVESDDKCLLVNNIIMCAADTITRNMNKDVRCICITKVAKFVK